jgi:Uma2 family endonuclease
LLNDELSDTDFDMEAVLENEVKSSEDFLHRFTVDDFHLMARVGMFPPDARVELLEGQIYNMSPIGPFHGGVSDILAEYFWETSKKRWIVRAQNPIHLGADSEPQPDIVLARPVRHRYKIRHPSPEDIFLVIEISQTSLTYDVGHKLSRYAQAGIPEVWIVDLNEEVLQIFRKPVDNTYTESLERRAGQFATPESFPDVSVDVGELFKRVL